MSRHIDAEAFFKVINTLPYKDTSYPDASVYNGAISDVADMLTHFPAADVVEVVRCADCKYKDKGQNECESWNMCKYRSWLYFPVNDDDYCSKGERNEQVHRCR